LRIGSLIATVLPHAFCNLMGLPAIGKMLEFDGWKRSLALLSLILGVMLFTHHLSLMSL